MVRLMPYQAGHAVQEEAMNRTKRIALTAMLVAVAFVLAWLEAQIPAFIAVPGVKLGLTNIVVMIALYKLGWRDAFIINLVRIVLVGVTFGSLYSLWYSLAGGMLSFIGMLICKNALKARLVTVSVVGGILHNLGQILVAVFVLDAPSLFYYLVVLWISGIIAGVVVGLICVPVVKRVKFE